MEWKDGSLFIAHYVNVIRELLVCNSVLFVCVKFISLPLRSSFQTNCMPKIPFESVISAPFIISFSTQFPGIRCSLWHFAALQTAQILSQSFFLFVHLLKENCSNIIICFAIQSKANKRILLCISFDEWK